MLPREKKLPKLSVSALESAVHLTAAYTSGKSWDKLKYIDILIIINSQTFSRFLWDDRSTQDYRMSWSGGGRNEIPRIYYSHTIFSNRRVNWRSVNCCYLQDVTDNMKSEKPKKIIIFNLLRLLISESLMNSLHSTWIIWSCQTSPISPEIHQ